VTRIVGRIAEDCHRVLSEPAPCRGRGSSASDHVAFNSVARVTTAVMIALTLLLGANGFGLKLGAFRV
jgi:hypothetical protein